MHSGINEDVKVHTNVIKRNGQEVTFDITKIINAIGKANNEVNEIHQLPTTLPRKCLPTRMLPTWKIYKIW